MEDAPSSARSWLGANGRHPSVSGVRTMIAGKYELLEPIGKGGMSTVWSAIHRDRGAERTVAVKLVKESVAGDDVAMERFRREAAIAARLQGRGFPTVYEWGLHGGAPYMVMELLVGENLAQRLKRVGTISVWEIMALLRRLGDAIGRAHAEGIVHRDVKTQNVFFADEGSFESVKLLDFGIAKRAYLDRRLTQNGLVVGSPHWMSPEQARGEDVDHRTDLWSLGVLVYQCLTGTLPFDGPMSSVLHQLLETKHRPVTAVSPKLPLAFDTFFDRALAKATQDRFQTAAEMVEAFEAVAATIGQPCRASIPELRTANDVPTVTDRRSEFPTE